MQRLFVCSERKDHNAGGAPLFFTTIVFSVSKYSLSNSSKGPTSRLITGFYTLEIPCPTYFCTAVKTKKAKNTNLLSTLDEGKKTKKSCWAQCLIFVFNHSMKSSYFQVKGLEQGPQKRLRRSVQNPHSIVMPKQTLKIIIGNKTLYFSHAYSEQYNS